MHRMPYLCRSFFAKEPYIRGIFAERDLQLNRDVGMCDDAIYIWWPRCIGCLKLQVCFRKRATNIGLCGRTRPIKIRHPVHLRHPVITDVPSTTNTTNANMIWGGYD